MERRTGPVPAAGAAAGAPTGGREAPCGRLVFVESLPMESLPAKTLELMVMPVAPDELARIVNSPALWCGEIRHYIKDGALAAALRDRGVPLPPEPYHAAYVWQPGDVIVVVTPKAIRLVKVV